MTPAISVIICTHNPREDYLRRVLGALDRQTLPKCEWELLLIDNASAEPLEIKYDLSWHPQARHVREEELGLTPARLRGIREALGQLLVFVDDDNVLDANYIKDALSIVQDKPFLGAFNGSINGVFEIEPPEWIQDFVGLMCVGEVIGDRWGYGPSLSARSFAPCGAGMVIRSEVAKYYAESVHSSIDRGRLDRTGKNFVSAGDADMAMCACNLGYAVGRLEVLRLDHLIPAQRLTKEYMLKLIEGLAYSDEWLYFIWNGVTTYPPSLPGKIEKLLQPYHYWRRKCKLSSALFEYFQFKEMAKQFENIGILKAQREIAQINRSREKS
jgi:glycosyltransferase involved in cell wall biosynthesis